MADIEPTAAAWMDAVRVECPILPPISVATVALQRALLQIKINEQELADFKQKVSDAAKDALFTLEDHGHTEAVVIASNRFLQFIIPKPKPDPLVDVANSLGFYNTAAKHWASDVRAALDALGFEIREKNDDN